MAAASAAPGREQVAQRLTRARVERTASRDLAFQGLEEVPGDLEWVNLSGTLNLAGNELTELPAWLGKLNLRRIDLRSNPLKSVRGLQNLVLDWSVVEANPRLLDSKSVIGVHLDSRWTTLPEPLRALGKNLQILDLGPWRDERIRAPELTAAIMREAVDCFPELTELDLFACGLRELPQELADLRTLRRLDLGENPLELLPSWLHRLRELRTLWASGTRLRELPPWVLELPRLEHLELRRNELCALPDRFAQARYLSGLWLADNLLFELPASFGALLRLETLDLSNNRLTVLPEPAFALHTLRMLSIQRREPGSELVWARTGQPATGLKQQSEAVTAIPSDVLRMVQLRMLDTTGQPISEPPLPVIGQGMDAIIAYWTQRLSEGVDFLCEAKLIIVGEPEAGKTTLARKLLNPSLPLDPQQASTAGIDVLRWTFPAAVRPKRLQASTVIGGLTVHVWDFGGQEILHRTHQFFLTRRSLYLLVADARAEDTDFQWWLETIDVLSTGCPVLIVLNEKQDKRRDIDELELRSRFANLKAVLRTNLADNRGLEPLIECVRRQIEALDHIGDPLPGSWRKVREALEADPRDYISQVEFFRLCRDHGFYDSKHALFLSSYLHDLGICLHYQDNPLLKHTVILSPQWATDAVYCLLIDEQVRDHSGRFNRTDLQRIWGSTAYEDMIDDLIELLVKFQFCYRLAQAEAWIAPTAPERRAPGLQLGEHPRAGGALQLQVHAQGPHQPPDRRHARPHRALPPAVRRRAGLAARRRARKVRGALRGRGGLCRPLYGCSRPGTKSERPAHVGSGRA